MPSANRRDPRPPNTDLARVITASGATRKSLAHRLNQLAASVGLRTSYTHTSWANWTTRGIRPAAPVRGLIVQVLSERLGRPVSLAEIALDHQDGDNSLLGLEFPRDVTAAVHITTRFWSQVDRRTFLARTGITVASYHAPVLRWLAVPSDDTAAAPSPQASRRVGRADLQELLATAEDARLWDSRYGGGNWRSSAITTCLKERATPLLRGVYGDAVGRELFSATAQLSRLAGWTAFDNGDNALAQRHYIQALRHARAAGDIPLGGYILACMALQVTSNGYHDEAIDMIDGAFHHARHHAPPRVLAFYKLIEARVHAHVRDGRAADTALAASEQLLTRADNHTGDDPTWIDFFDHRRLAADAVEIHRDLGQPVQALRWNTLATMPAGKFARSHAIRNTVLASVCLLGAAPDLDRALGHGHHAVTVLASVRSARAAAYLAEFMTELSRWRTEPGVVTLAHRVRTEVAAV